MRTQGRALGVQQSAEGALGMVKRTCRELGTAIFARGNRGVRAGVPDGNEGSEGRGARASLGGA